MSDHDRQAEADELFRVADKWPDSYATKIIDADATQRFLDRAMLVNAWSDLSALDLRRWPGDEAAKQAIRDAREAVSRAVVVTFWAIRDHAPERTRDLGTPTGDN